MKCVVYYSLFNMKAFLVSLWFIVVNLWIQPSGGQELCVGQCPDGWTYFRQSCYLFVDNMKVDWPEAVHFCQSHHAELAVVETREEDLFLGSFVKRLFRYASDRNFDGSFWLGGSDSTVEDLWTWYTNDQAIQYTSWSPGHPDKYNGNDEDCLYMAAFLDYKWDDISCTDYKLHPICEISPYRLNYAKVTCAVCWF